ncbi:MAG: rod shape-determining protein MreD [Lachnospiraceae bacterium]|nr:rod shape-determining protein MreD [Lachnospiraceae bacterium]MDE6626131.1 rod shape-determining protein MreD [Lachnospiraceae bacterium]
MKRCITIAIIIIICFLCQSTVFHYLKLADVVPNLLLIATMSFGLMRGRKEGLLVGFFSGLLIDIYFGRALGPYAFIYMSIGYVNGFFHRIYYVEDVLLPMIMITLNDFIYNIIIYIVYFLLRNKLSFTKYCMDVIVPEMIYTILITLFFYKILVRINKRLKRIKEAG